MGRKMKVYVALLLKLKNSILLTLQYKVFYFILKNASNKIVYMFSILKYSKIYIT